MQKLEERNTYTPVNVPQVRSNCDPSLNVEETLSVPGLKTSSNSSDAALTGFEKFQSKTRESVLKKLLYTNPIEAELRGIKEEYDDLRR